MLQRHIYITDIRNKRIDGLFEILFMKIFIFITINKIEHKASSKSDNFTNY